MEFVCSPRSCLHLCGSVCFTDSCIPGLRHLALSAPAPEPRPCMALLCNLEVGTVGGEPEPASAGHRLCTTWTYVDLHSLVLMVVAKAEPAMWGPTDMQSQRT